MNTHGATPDAGDASEASHPRSPSCSMRSCGQEPLPTKDASTSASEPLSEDERDHLGIAALGAGHSIARRIEAAVERIVAAREAKARAEAGEQIAQAIETDGRLGMCTTWSAAARIAREVTQP